MKKYLSNMSFVIFTKIEDIFMGFSEKIPLLRPVIHGLYPLKSYVCIATLLISLISFYAAFLIAFNIYQNTIEKRTREVSNTVSGQVYSSMLLLMEKGWSRDEVKRFLNTFKSDEEQLPYIVNIYRGKIVKGLYGSVSGEEPDNEAKGVFSTGQSMFIKSGYILKNIYPIKSSEVCTGCHFNAKNGEVLGVIKIQQDIGPVISQAKKRFIIFFVVFLPLPFIMAGLTSTFLNARIRRSTGLFYERIRGINSVKELRSLEIGMTNLGFTEFNKIFSEIEEFTGKIRNIAIDKELLEFEIKILEQFVITSEVIKGWKEYIDILMLEVNKVMDMYFIFSVFQVGNDFYDLDIFWRNRPSDLVKEKIEKAVLERINKEEAGFQCNKLSIIHNITDSAKGMPEIDERTVEMQVKSFALQVPHMVGLVGIGAPLQMNEDRLRTLAIDGILAALVNMIGSVKAISKYTSDLEYYATRDPLTMLYNQRMFWELLGYEIGRALRYGYKFSVFVIDLDNFKIINDSHGHTIGDKFLIELATTLRDFLRQGDILARYGGDEFVVLLTETDSSEALNTALRIKDKIEETYVLTPEGKQVKATASIGISVFPDHADNAQDLFVFADNMMYQAKTEGKNRISTPKPSDMIGVLKAFSEKSLLVVKAIEEKRIIPYFQPIKNIHTDEIECYEVLSIIETENGILTAGEFIEIAERIGIITRLDLVIIDKVFEKIRNEGANKLFFINISPKSMVIGDFLSDILEIAKRHGTDHERIVFEITERETVKKPEVLENFIKNLKSKGFKFALDDFGAGFSTFQYVRRLPLDFVKIEGEFIRNITESAKDFSIVRTLQVLASGFNIKTVAEHVEHSDILEAVKNLNIDYVQGYHIGKPSADFFNPPNGLKDLIRIEDTEKE
ncbi:MAG: bifunctional diguanylate cyclase/phosphodiesterase [Nitrospirae bacterium]|nr:bifunctional diguanylate cyclase/phosphodiesterase [Nitrospirota bacterium]